MFDGLMRIVTTLVGLIMICMGAVWMMQGLGIGPAAIMQGFMVNNIQWTFYGAILAVVGVAQIVWAWSRARG
jgi:ABC-type lipoprotein release transport system permease subunit